MQQVGEFLELPGVQERRGQVIEESEAPPRQPRSARPPVDERGEEQEQQVLGGALVKAPQPRSKGRESKCGEYGLEEKPMNDEQCGPDDQPVEPVQAQPKAESGSAWHDRPHRGNQAQHGE
ncbi:hypothetical protein D3C85_1405340 [compost metagenome]